MSKYFYNIVIIFLINFYLFRDLILYYKTSKYCWELKSAILYFLKNVYLDDNELFNKDYCNQFVKVTLYLFILNYLAINKWFFWSMDFYIIP